MIVNKITSVVGVEDLPSPTGFGVFVADIFGVFVEVGTFVCDGDGVSVGCMVEIDWQPRKTRAVMPTNIILIKKGDASVEERFDIVFFM